MSPPSLRVSRRSVHRRLFRAAFGQPLASERNASDDRSPDIEEDKTFCTSAKPTGLGGGGDLNLNGYSVIGADNDIGDIGIRGYSGAEVWCRQRFGKGVYLSGP